jgi:hypothetical protein
MPGCLPAVHRQSVSTIGCPPNPARRPGSRCPARPASGPSGVQPVQCRVYLAPSSGRGCPAGWCPARPVSSRRVSVRPVAAVSSRVRRVVAMGRPRSGGQRSRLDRVEFHVVRPRPRRLGRRPEAHGCGHRCEVVCRPAGERPPRTWAGWCFGGRLHPTGRAGQTAAGGGGLSLATALGRGVAGARLPHGTVRRGHLAWSHDYSAWSLPSLTSEWMGPEGPHELGGQDGDAAPARPSQVASATGSTLATL